MVDEDYIVEIVSESDGINSIEIYECPICLNDISESEFYITTNCCNKNIHTDCLCKWYKNRGKSKNKFKQNCFLCTKMLDDTVKDVINNFIKDCETNNLSSNYNNVNRNLINRNNTDNTDNRDNRDNDCKKVIIQYLTFASILIFSFLFFFLILL